MLYTILWNGGGGGGWGGGGVGGGVGGGGGGGGVGGVGGGGLFYPHSFQKFGSKFFILGGSLIPRFRYNPDTVFNRSNTYREIILKIHLFEGQGHITYHALIWQNL